ncbi:hypothetical protein SAY87_028453 [Trapa incisa]|uniref:Acid phosphatase/vanadium-dependent haloperoxidase-related protein n=1 Tax=Trapa incisa TaxID=236973 RepID=A0AAN7QNP2_9MYRT|nr:hypothetical protein SAY87_028453 [Trapa incisa]
MGDHAHCWVTCYSLSSYRLPRPSGLPLRFRSLNKTRDFNGVNGSRKRKTKVAGSLRVGVEDLAQILHNKALVAATASAAIGQLSKPFTSAFLYRKRFDLMAASQPGGFPSTHSSAVVAAATSLALERGFSDSIFGLAVVYASIVMYDAQGVRMEVGKHAQVMNRVLIDNSIGRNIQSSNGKSTVLSSCSIEQTDYEETMVGSYNYSRSAVASTLLREDGRKEEETEEEAVGAGSRLISPLKETVGHTRVEVMAGALLGFLVGVILNVLQI